MRDENAYYYAQRRISPGPYTFKQWMSKVQKAAKPVYHKLARGEWDKEQGKMVGGGELAYQKLFTGKS